jgi:hypothetical protein
VLKIAFVPAARGPVCPSVRIPLTEPLLAPRFAAEAAHG